MNTKNIIKYLAAFLCLFTFAIPQMNAQEVDDLQEYLDKLAEEQQVKQNPRMSNLRGETVTIPVGLTEVDLSKFTSYQNRTKVVSVKSSVKFTNGTIAASSSFAGETPLLKIYNGATVVLDTTAGINASNINVTNCTGAVGIYGGSTFYQCGDITAPSNGTGVAIYLDSSSDTYNYVSGTTLGTISNPNGGTIIGLDGDPEAYAVVSGEEDSYEQVLTFYYDGKKNRREGTIYTADKFRTNADDGWADPFGEIAYIIFDSSFANYHELTSTAYWFYLLRGVRSISGLHYLNTENVTNMKEMFGFKFSENYGIASLDLSSFNTEKVTNMSGMFDESRIESLNLNGFNTSNVTDMSYMFYNCFSMNNLDISSFNTNKVTNMKGMFGSSNLYTIHVGKEWTTDNVDDKYSEYMFTDCRFLVGGDGTKYNSKYTDKTKAYAGIGGYLTMEGQEIGPEDYAVLSTDKTTLTFYYDTKKGEREGTVYTDVNNMYDNKWYGGNFSTVVFDKSFADYKGLTDMSYWFCKCGNLSSVTGLEYVNTDNVTTMTYMFYSCYNLNTLDLRSFNTAKVTNMGSMFNGCTNLTTIQVGNLWTTDNVTYSSSMFSSCTNLVGGDGTKFDYSYTDKTKAYAGVGGYLTLKQEGAPEAYAVLSTDNTMLSFYYDGEMENQEGTVYTVDEFRKSNEDAWGSAYSTLKTVVFDSSFAKYEGITSTKMWFWGCTELTSIVGIENLKTLNVTDYTRMFQDCTSLTELNVSGFNTEKAYTMYGMFMGCSGLKTLDVSGFNTKNVTNMTSMFSGCTSLTRLDVSNFNTENVTGMSWMFASCTELTNLDVSGFKTDNVGYMQSTFANCPNLTTLDVSKFNTSNVVTMYAMFMDCSSLKNIDVSGFETGKVTRMDLLFENCSSLTKLDLSNFNTSNVESMREMFNGCSGIVNLDLGSFNTSKVNDMYRMFYNCNNLETIYVGVGWNTGKVTTSYSMFQYCDNLVGGDGTKYSSTYMDKTKAYVGSGGYLTEKINYTYDMLKKALADVGTDLLWMSKQYDEVNTEFQGIAKWFDEKARGIMEDSLKVVYAVLEDYTKEKATLDVELETAPESDYAVLYKNIEALAMRVAAEKKEWPQTMNDVVEFIKEKAASGMQWYLKLMGENVNNDWKRMDETTAERLRIQRAVGEGYFLYAATEKFCTDSTQTAQKGDVVMSKLGDLGKGYNTLVNNASISSIGDIGIVYAKYDELQTMQKDVDGELREYANMVQALGEQLLTLTLTFPDTEDMFYTVAPKDIKDELQLGYKSNRGFVLTSAGIMLFEQKEGADFYLLDNEENYITLETQGDTVLLAEGTKEEAAIWTGTNLGNGSYTFYNQANKRYLGYSGVKVNNAIVAGRQRYAWTIEESELDDLQAFLNLLSEEEEESETETELTENDTLVIVLPEIEPEIVIPTTPVVFPKVIYPVVIKPLTGEVPHPHYFPIPAPVPGQRRPSDFHPVNIPRGSHVILDDVTFQDIVGGDHIIYVDGTVEININVDIFIDNWDRFIHCGPTGRVIWHPKRPATGAWPKVLNEGEFELADKDSFVGEVENTGTVTQKEGTIDRVINRKTYYFTGGIINDYRNYGTHHHQGGTIITARNFEDATFEMTDGVIDNPVENTTDTIFVNRGTFNFTGGIIRGWGSRLFYHAKGAKLRIDGGIFDFTHVKDYFIEAYDDFYIRGDYDYKPTVPMLLSPKVVVNILYKWNYNFNVVFIGGRPAPRYPLFRGPANYLFTLEDFERIGWNLPNKRWRWYIDPKENTIEPRDEEVEDEDDLQAYLDWLAENQESESQSTEEEPQELELSTRTITITEPVVLPVGTHVLWRNGNFTPQNTWDWSNGKPVFEVPSQSSVRFNKVIFNFSNTTHYMVGGVPMQRRLMHVLGDFYFDANSYIKGYFDRTRAMADDYIPGAYIDLDPASRFFYSGGHLDNVVLRLNQVVNIYVTCSITTDLHLYVPSAYLTEGFRLLASDGKYSLKKTDLKNIVLHCTEDFWSVTIDAEGYVCLKRGKEIEQPMELAKGWNWASIGLGNINDLVSFLSPIADQVEEIKSQTQSLINDSKYGLIGNLTRLNAQDGYRFRMKQQKNVTWKGMGSLADDTPVSIVKGWNWIGYVPTFDLTLSEALSGLTPSEGDQIRGFDGFADYKNGVWTGSLTTMRQGESYQYYAVEAATFYYPMQKPAAQAASRAKEQNVQPKAPWTYDAHLYPDVQTMILRLCADGKKIDGYNVAAFCNGECRGIAKQVDNLLFLTVHGTLSDKETIDFVAYDPKSNQAIEVEEAVDFNGQRWGDIDAPMLLNLGGVTTEIGTLASASISFTMEGNCLYLRGNTEGIQSIHIFSADGTQVYAAQGYATSGIALGTLSKGVYVVNITMTDNTTLRKKILW